jgi:hypothetical protein
VSIMSFLRILFGKGINATSEELLELFVAQTYPAQQLLDVVAELQRRRGIPVDTEAIFASASACCAVAVVGVAYKFKASLLGHSSENLHAILVQGWAETYKSSHQTGSSVEDLRRRILNAFGALSKAATRNPTPQGQASSYHAARMASLLIDPDEANLDETKVLAFATLMEQKYKSALGFFDTLSRNNRL